MKLRETKAGVGTMPLSDRPRVLVVAVVLSVLAHVGVALAVYNRPLGRIDASLLEAQTYQMELTRGPFDSYVSGDPAQDRPREPDRPSARDLSTALLEQSVEASPMEQSVSAPLALRDFKEAAIGVGGSLEADPTAGSGAVVASLESAAPVRTRYVPAPDTGGAGEAPDILGGSNSRAAADALLKEALPPVVATGPRATGPVLAPPEQGPGFFDSPTPFNIDQAAIAQAPDLPIVAVDNAFRHSAYIYEAGQGRGYFRVDLTAAGAMDDVPHMPKDVVFVIDTSSSLPQAWVDAAARAVGVSLSALNPEDRFNIAMFTEAVRVLSTEGPLPADDDAMQRAADFLKAAQSSGYTDVNQALSRLLVRDVGTERTYNLVLVSDGLATRGVRDTRELLKIITRDNDLQANIFCVGVGPRVNRELLEMLAFRNKGEVNFVQDPDQVTAALRELIGRIRYPLMKDVQLSAAGAAVHDLMPRPTPDIHHRQTVSVYGRYDRLGRMTLGLTGLNGERVMSANVEVDLRTAHPTERRTAARWALWRAHHLATLLLQPRPNEQSLRAELADLVQRFDLNVIE